MMLVLVTMMKLLMMMMMMVVLVVGGAPRIGQEPPDDPSERCRVRASQVPQPTCFQLESLLAMQLGEKIDISTSPGNLSVSILNGKWVGEADQRPG